MKCRLLASVVFLANAALGGELVVFSRESCPPCEAFKADLAQDPSMAAGHRVVFADSNDELWEKLGVKATPTFVLIDDQGGKARMKTGYRNKREFVRWLSK